MLIAEKTGCWVQFGDIVLNQLFWARDTLWVRVPKAVDRMGGYNAQVLDTGKRELFFMHQMVEVQPDGH